MEQIQYKSSLCHSARGKLAAYFLCSAFRGLALPAEMVLVQRIIDSIAAGGMLARRYILVLGLVFLADLVLFHAVNYMELLIRDRIEYNGGDYLLKRCGEIRYQYYEDGEIYRKIQEIMSRYKDAEWGRIQSWAFALQLAFRLTGILYYLILAGPWIAVLLTIAMVPPLLLSIHAVKKEFVSWETFFPFYLKARYLTELLTKRRSVREARIFQYRRYVESAWEDALKKFNRGQIASNLKPRYLTGFCVFLQYAITIAVLFALFPQVQAQTLTVGVFTAAAQAMWSFTGEFQYGVIQMAKGFQESRMFDEKISYFLSLDREVPKQVKEIPVFCSLELRDIWYRYSEHTPYILKGVSMKLDSTHKAALVGANGSGKTTLIKILLGLLVPEKGEILLNGTPVTDENRELLRKSAGAVFQDYIKYNLSLSESMNLGRREADVSEEEVMEMFGMLQPDGSLSAEMRDGLDTFLGKDVENGCELSGGQWQSISQARAMLSDRPILILDEPTAALDPLAEAAVYDLIYEKKREKSVLLVTHRLGAVVHADCIFVLKDGKISECGTHEELMRAGDDYAGLFETQRHWYILKEEKRGGDSDEWGYAES